MGIKHLNQFVKRECPGAIKTVAFADMAGKVIVIDASIYMYRFLADQALLENMYTMITMFQLRGIVPVFVFDGKPPDEKRRILNRRRRLKQIAEMHYNKVKVQLDLTPANKHLLQVLKRRFIRLQDADFERVKTLMQALGVDYIVASGEADALCAQMVLKHKAHACMSDDTDMFVYGCPRVLRHLNLMDETFTLYDMSQILNLLGITMTEFRQICVVSGTDYSHNHSNHNHSNHNHSNHNHSNHNHDDAHHSVTNDAMQMKLHLKLTLKLFKQYKKCAQEAAETDSIVAPDFYTWLHHNCSAIYPRVRFDHDAITSIYEMFDLTNVRIKFPFHKNKTNDPDPELLRKVMAHENFIFV